MRSSTWTALLALVALFSSAGCAPDREVPLELLGEWRTGHPRYEGRGMWIEADTVRFETGEGVAAHAIQEVRSEGKVTAIRYGPSSTPYDLRLRWTPDGGIVLVSQPGAIWRKGAR